MHGPPVPSVPSQLKLELGLPTEPIEGSAKKLSTSLASLEISKGWLNTLKASSLNSRLLDSRFGILKAFVTETSKRYKDGVRPALRPRFPVRNLKSTG